MLEGNKLPTKIMKYLKFPDSNLVWYDKHMFLSIVLSQIPYRWFETYFELKLSSQSILILLIYDSIHIFYNTLLNSKTHDLMNI